SSSETPSDGPVWSQGGQWNHSILWTSTDFIFRSLLNLRTDSGFPKPPPAAHPHRVRQASERGADAPGAGLAPCSRGGEVAPVVVDRIEKRCPRLPNVPLNPWRWGRCAPPPCFLDDPFNDRVPILLVSDIAADSEVLAQGFSVQLVEANEGVGPL